MTKQYTSSFEYKVISGLTVLSLILAIVVPHLVNAASITAAKDTMTRLEISTTADHDVRFTLPSGVDFDSGDELKVDFPTSSAFTQGGTWAAGDFTFSNDGASADIANVDAGATPDGVASCTNDSNNVEVEVDTDDIIFRIIPCGASYTAGNANGDPIIFTIDGTTANGTLTNPSSAASYAVDIGNDEDNDGDYDDTTQIAVGIADSDQVAVTATVNASLTFDLDTASGGGSGESSAPYSVAFGVVPTSSVRVSGGTDSVQMIVAEADTNATSGVVVTVINANGTNGLVSTSTPSDNINSGDGTMSAGTENYGLCVATANLSGFSRASPYDTGTCAADTETNAVYNLTTTGENILSTTGPVAAAHAEIIANATASGTTVAHTDYTDTLTFVATGTF